MEVWCGDVCFSISPIPVPEHTVTPNKPKQEVSNIIHVLPHLPEDCSLEPRTTRRRFSTHRHEA